MMPLRRRHLADHRLEARIVERGDVECALLEHREHAVGHLLRLAKAICFTWRKSMRSTISVGIVAAQDVVALAADDEDLDRLAFGQQPPRILARQPRDRAVEGAGKAALAGADDEQMHVLLARCRRSAAARPAAGRRCGDVGEHRAHALGIGPRRHRRFLRAPQLRRGHHLHGLGDLLRRLHRGDAVAESL